MSTTGPAATYGYLLDLNILRAWQNPAHADHQKVLGRMAALGAAPPIFMSAVTLGEIEFGHRVSEATSKAANKAFEHFISTQFPAVLPISKTTAPYYGDLKAKLFDRFAPKDATGRRRKHTRVAQLTDPLSDLALGIDENDLWCAAVAVEYNLVLVSHDGMQRIRDVANGQLQVEDWRV